MKKLTIEWRHFDKEGATCDRCAATGTSVREVVSELRNEMAERGIEVILSEKLIPEELMAQSNMILFNGVALEDLLDDAAADKNSCPSCSCLTGAETNCRTVEYKGKTYEDIPGELIRRAAYKVLSHE